MAIAVPLIMAGAGAATTTILATSLVLGVTGISSKIDKAATKVFGKDLVTLGNIAGAAFMAFGGGFGGAASGTGEAAAQGLDAAEAAFNGSSAAGPAITDPTAAGYVNSLDAASDAAQAATGAGQGALQAASVTPTAGGVAERAADAAKSVGGAVKDAVSTGAKAWAGADPKTKGALLQVGGNLLAGAMQAKAADKTAQEQRDYESKYRSGSGVKYWAKPTGGV